MRSVLVRLSATFIMAWLLWGCVPIPPPRDNNASEQLVLQGVRELRNEDLESAFSAFSAALAVARDPVSLDGLGCVMLRRGDLKMAQRYFEEAIDLDSGYSHAYGHLALVAQKRRDLRRAQELFERALIEDPLNIEARGNFTRLLRDKGYEALSTHEEKMVNVIQKSGVEH